MLDGRNYQSVKLGWNHGFQSELYIYDICLINLDPDKTKHLNDAEYA